MLNWQAEMRRANKKVQEQMERHLAKVVAPVQTKKVADTNKKAKADKPKRERTTAPKVILNNWDVDLSVAPANVKRVDGYFKSNITDSIHKIATVPTPVKKTADKVKKTKQAVKTVAKSTLRIVDGKRIWTHQGNISPTLLARLGLV